MALSPSSPIRRTTAWISSSDAVRFITTSTSDLHRPRGPQLLRPVQERVVDLVLALRGVPVDEDPDASGERAGDRDLLTAHERHLGPAELAGGERRELRVEVRGHGEPRVADVLGPNAVQAHHDLEQLTGRGEDRVAAVALDGRRAGDASPRPQALPASARPRTNAPS